MEPEGQIPASKRFTLPSAQGGLHGKVLRVLSDGHILAVMKGPMVQYRGKEAQGQDYVMLVHPQEIVGADIPEES